ncbi:MAG TPA: RNA 3'-terminal phosphate cyclase [Nitrosopumilaceae archaeon]|nr:RNA 3'-terminal phosphate cyclase [Nitrosopumilaceae archaeon]
MELVKIDGAYGEGGGQIVRSAVTLSCLTQKPVEIVNIRKNRKVPGLRPQHLTGIKILAKICKAKVEGLSVGSTSIRFFPSKIDDMQLKEDIGTAGSIPLILQVLIPSVSISKKRLKMSITGGTDVLWSPTSDYTRFVLREAYARLGISFQMDIKRRGYYPRGGGIVNLEVFPREKISSISLLKRTSKSVKIFCTYSGISSHLIEQQVSEAKNVLLNAGFDCDYQITQESAYDKGCSFLVYTFDENCIIGSDAINGKEMSKMGHFVASRFLESTLGVDQFLSDMLVIPLCLTDGESIFRVNQITKHLETNLFVTTEILNCKYGIGRIDGGFEVRISGNSNTSI